VVIGTARPNPKAVFKITAEKLFGGDTANIIINIGAGQSFGIID